MISWLRRKHFAAWLAGAFFLLGSASYSDTLPTLVLAWDAPATGDVTGYNIYMGTQSGVTSDGEFDLHLYSGHVHVGNQGSVTVFVTNPATYFTVTAVNDAGEGPPSNELLVTQNGDLARTQKP